MNVLIVLCVEINKINDILFIIFFFSKFPTLLCCPKPQAVFTCKLEITCLGASSLYCWWLLFFGKSSKNMICTEEDRDCL